MLDEVGQVGFRVGKGTSVGGSGIKGICSLPFNEAELYFHYPLLLFINQ